MLTYLSLFSGVGGLDLGFEDVGFRCVGCVENDELARETLIANGCGPMLVPADVVEFSGGLQPSSLGLSVGELDVVLAAPPCQPFSAAGQWTSGGRKGLQDPRGQLLSSLFAVVRKLQPRAVVIENVPGFVAGPVSALRSIRASVGSINRMCGTEYSMHYRVLDAADYGVPQHRKRAIVILTRNGKEFSWPPLTHAVHRVPAYAALKDVTVRSVPQAEGKWAQLLPAIPEGANYLFHTPGGPGEPLFGHRTRYWSFLLKLSKEKPSWTLAAQPGPATGPFHWDNRPLAPEEMLALQSFPDDWKLSGSFREQVRQAGNATPPLLARAVASSLLRTLGAKQRGRASLRIRAKVVPATIPEPEKVKPVPAKYLRLRGNHRPHPGTGLGPQGAKLKRSGR